MACGLVLFSASAIFGKDRKPQTTQDLELLEFLGSWETQDGTWIDPLELADPSRQKTQTGTTFPDFQSSEVEETSSTTQGNQYHIGPDLKKLSPEQDDHE